jgi:hypothetical protein
MVDTKETGNIGLREHHAQRLRFHKIYHNSSAAGYGVFKDHASHHKYNE